MPSLNLVALLAAGFLVLFMQAGFALVDMGLCRAKNAAITMSMSLMVLPLCGLAFWMYGFAILGCEAQGGMAMSSWPCPPHAQGDVGMAPDASDPGLAAWFFWTLVLCATAAAIPTGAMAERWRWRSFCLYGLWVALPFSILANWIWGGGWLAKAGTNWGLGHGVVDFAGSGVVHAVGGAIGLAGCVILGPRIGKYVKGKPIPFPAHQVPMVVLGTFILAFGWLGLNSGWTVVGGDVGQQARMPVLLTLVVVNTVLAGAAGAVAVMLTLIGRSMKPEPTMVCDGLLGGLVAVSGSCAFIDAWAAISIGAVAGVLVVAGIFFWERRGVDDPAGAVTVHGLGGLWGMIAVGVFANGKYGSGWNGVVREVFQSRHGSDGVRGLLYGDPSQLAAQLIGAAAIGSLAFGMAYLLFKVSRRIVPMRVASGAELEGLDVPEMGTRGYPDFTVTGRL